MNTILGTVFLFSVFEQENITNDIKKRFCNSTSSINIKKDCPKYSLSSNNLKNVIAIGFEPMTVCLEGRCSIQLSYATKICGETGIRTQATFTR